jgi:hypothetical protein
MTAHIDTEAIRRYYNGRGGWKARTDIRALCDEVDRLRRRPPWADGEPPDINMYLASEAFVAGALSTLEPFREYHPAWCLPFARQALDALSEWEPSE